MKACMKREGSSSSRAGRSAVTPPKSIAAESSNQSIPLVTFQATLPAGMELVVTYDRSDLIHRAIDTLKEEIVKLGALAGSLEHLPRRQTAPVP